MTGMKTRVISGLVAIVLLIIITLSDNVIFGAAITCAALIGVYEFYKAVANAGVKPIRIIGYLACLPIFFIGLNGRIGIVAGYLELFKSVNYISLGVFVILVVLFSITIFLHDRYNLYDISLTVFGIFYVVFLFSFVVLTRNLEGGKYFIWLIFIGAWVTDTFAYFTGVTMGRTKILPAVSPKKSLEGMIGGIIGALIVTVVFGYMLNRTGAAGVSIPLYHFVIIGSISGIISQIGDWAASAVKRYVKIKDYGAIMPGHGGVLDRFDSILFIAPVVYFYLSFLIVK